MNKKVLKSIALALAFAIVLVPCMYFPITSVKEIFSEIKNGMSQNKTSPNVGVSFNGDALTFTPDNAVSGYNTAKAVLSQSDDFGGLILDKGLSDVQIFDCAGEEPQIEYLTGKSFGVIVKNVKKSETYNTMEIYYSEIANSMNVTLTEGRWIETEKIPLKNEPLELLTGSDSVLPINTKVWLNTGLVDGKNQCILLPAIIVGKVKTNSPIPHAGRQSPIPAFGKTADIAFLQNPFDTYVFENFNDQPIKNTYNKDAPTKNDLYNDEGVTFRIAKKNNTSKQISPDLIVKAAKESNSSIHINYGYNATVQKMANQAVRERVLILSVIAFSLMLILTGCFIKTMIKIWKKK
ncbi:MAG: hypothetical protein RR552_05325 [Oscillospiraceae bacterium]